jgi:hypothetical protein
LLALLPVIYLLSGMFLRDRERGETLIDKKIVTRKMNKVTNRMINVMRKKNRL